MTDFGIGIVIPNYNGQDFIRECVRSILAQSVKVACVVIDGRSTDYSLERVAVFDKNVTIISEADNGQADAIRKGIELINTELVGWLNSDDILTPRAAEHVVNAARAKPEAIMFHGDVEYVDANGGHISHSSSIGLDYRRMRAGSGKTLQPGSFYRRDALMHAGNVDPGYHLLMDVDLWIRLLRLGPACRIDATLAKFRVHEAAKSSQPPWRYYRETLKIARRHQADAPVRSLLGRARQIGLHLLRYGIKKARV